MMSNRKSFIDALGKLQKSMHVKKSNISNYFSFRNAEQILKVAKDNLPDGFAIIIKSSLKEQFNKPFFYSTAIFTDGENKETCTCFVPIPSKLGSMSEPQIYGACSSYAKKYALCDLLAVDDSDQDIDNHHQKPANPNKNSTQDTAKANVNNTRSDTAKANVNNTRSDTGEANPAITKAWDEIKKTMEEYNILESEVKQIRDANFEGKSFKLFTSDELAKLNYLLGKYGSEKSKPNNNVNNGEVGKDQMFLDVKNQLQQFTGGNDKMCKAFYKYFGKENKFPFYKWDDEILLNALTELSKCNNDPEYALNCPIFKDAYEEE